MAFQVLNTNMPGTSDRFRDPSNTFVGLAFDHRLNYNSVSGNEDVIDAFFEWLNARAGSNLKSVIFAGHSRGGALVTKLAQRFAHEGPPHVKLVVQLYEPVAEKKELYRDPDTNEQSGRFSKGIDNPRRPSGTNWKGRLVRWERAFNRPTAPTDVRVLNVTGGQCVLWGICVRPMTGEPPEPWTTAWTLSVAGEEFFEQCWVLTDHMMTSFDWAGGDPDDPGNTGRGIRHLLASCKELGCL